MIPPKFPPPQMVLVEDTQRVVDIQKVEDRDQTSAVHVPTKVMMLRPSLD